MFIDIHCHCHVNYIPGLVRTYGVRNTRYPTPEELMEIMDIAGIDMAVMLCMVNPETRYCYVTPDEVLATCRKYPDRLIPFCSLDPRFMNNSTKSDFMPTLQTFKEEGFKAVGEYIPNLPFDDPLNMNLFRQVAEIGFPLQFHVGPKIGECYGCYDEIGLPRLEKVLKEVPDLIFLAHSQPFWAEMGTDVTLENRNTYPTGKVTPGRVVELMRNYPNLHGDLSGGSGLNAISRDPDFGNKFLDEFQDRLYYGTDIASASKPSYPQVEYFKKLKKEGVITDEAYEKITWKNAVKLLKLDIK